MNNITRIAVAAAAVLVVAVLGYNVLPRTGGVGGQVAATPTPTPSPTATPIPLNGQANLAGRYLVGSGLASRVTVAVPAGWTASGDWVVIGPKGNQAPNGMAIRFYAVQNVYKNPLAKAEGGLNPPVGPTVADLANAIASHPAWMATQPTDITIDGRAGKHVQVTIPTDVKFGTDRNFYFFSDSTGGDIWGWVPGQVFDFSIVDVGGERVVIDVFHYPGTSAGDLAEQQSVLDSIRLDPGP